MNTSQILHVRSVYIFFESTVWAKKNPKSVRLLLGLRLQHTHSWWPPVGRAVDVAGRRGACLGGPRHLRAGDRQGTVAGWEPTMERDAGHGAGHTPPRMGFLARPQRNMGFWQRGVRTTNPCKCEAGKVPRGPCAAQSFPGLPYTSEAPVTGSHGDKRKLESMWLASCSHGCKNIFTIFPIWLC